MNISRPLRGSFQGVCERGTYPWIGSCNKKLLGEVAWPKACRARLRNRRGSGRFWMSQPWPCVRVKLHPMLERCPNKSCGSKLDQQQLDRWFESLLPFTRATHFGVTNCF